MNERVVSLLKNWSYLPQAVCHQAAWWACVIWMGWIGPIAMGVFLAAHMAFCRKQWAAECTLIAAATGVGVVVDNVLASIGAVEYVGSITVGSSPLWLVSIWAGFGATLRHSQHILVRSRRHALLTGALGGPAAYWGGERLERMTISDVQGWFAVAVTWTAALLILEAIARANENR